MSKINQNTALEQVMDELNEEMPSSVKTSPNLLSPDLFNEPTKEELSELENLLSFEPNRNNYQEEVNQTSSKPALVAEQEDLVEQAVSNKKIKKLKKPTKSDVKKEKAKKPTKLDVKKEKANESILPDLQKPQAPLELKNKKPLMKGAIDKMAGFYKQPVDSGISISLKQSENLRVAQERIIALEGEIDRLRKENEELISAGDIFRERVDKINIQNDNLKKSYEENREEFQEEKRTLMNTLNDQSREIDKMAIKNKELEKRLSNNIQQIRVRERELENRLELMKLDSQTLVREKDQYILDLKRQMDKIKIDLDMQKNKYTETEQKLKGQKNQTRRATRGLQMDLHILKGHDFSLEEREEEIETEQEQEQEQEK